MNYTERSERAARAWEKSEKHFEFAAEGLNSYIKSAFRHGYICATMDNELEKYQANRFEHTDKKVGVKDLIALFDQTYYAQDIKDEFTGIVKALAEGGNE